jgi:hypothetical protein
MARRPFRARNLAVNVAPTGRLAQITERLKICVLHTHICLGWTHCRLFTHYCGTWLSWCKLFTCRWHTLNCQRPYSWVACRLATGPDIECPGPSAEIDFEDILVDPEIYVRQVAELRADLQEALKQLDAHEKEIGDVTKGG